MLIYDVEFGKVYNNNTNNNNNNTNNNNNFIIIIGIEYLTTLSRASDVAADGHDLERLFLHRMSTTIDHLSGIWNNWNNLTGKSNHKKKYSYGNH